MDYALHEEVSFCDVAGRLLFLDLRQDRYFCLAPDGEAAFRVLLAEDIPDERQREALDRLLSNGALRFRPGSPVPKPCSAPLAAETSLLDAPTIIPTTSSLGAAMIQLVAVPIELRLFGLAYVLRRTERRKGEASGEPHGEARAVVAAFQRIGSIITAHDRCLPRSIAVARRLIALGHRPDLLIGVKLQPFKAHCWVQLGSVIVNERRDVTRAFTPILVL
ncbi:lasso peptide biosynthesis B2 protein [Sphingomonas sp. UYP23]